MISEVSTAYILQIHKNPQQVNLFMKQLLTDADADIYVHIDHKNRQQVQAEIMEDPRVIILQQSINCEWGDISQVDTTILLLKEVLAAQKKYDYVCLRSGQDLLIRPGFKTFLGQNNGKLFMTIRQSGRNNLASMKIYWPKIMRRRYTTAHPLRIYRRLLQSLYRRGLTLFPNRNYWPKEYTFYNGSQWFSLPYEVVSYIIQFIEEQKWYHAYFEHTLCPDEWYFQTLIMNSPYKNEVINNNLLFLKWGESFSEANSPQNLTCKDISALESSEHYFARKFEESVDSDVITYFADRVRMFDGGR